MYNVYSGNGLVDSDLLTPERNRELHWELGNTTAED